MAKKMMKVKYKKSKMSADKASGGKVPSANMMGAQSVPSAMTMEPGDMKGTMSMDAGNVPSAVSAYDGKDMIGANLGVAQQIDMMEQKQMVDSMRMQAKKRAAMSSQMMGEVTMGPTTVMESAPMMMKKSKVKKKK